MLMPKRVKYRKTHIAKPKGYATRGTEIVFGQYGLRAMEPAWVTARQIEAARVALTRYLKQGSKIWLRIFPDRSVTKKAAESRLGKGKGDPAYWVSIVRPGRIIIELEGPLPEEAKKALDIAAHKFPMRTKFTVRYK